MARRSADCVAADALCQLFVLSRADLERILAAFPDKMQLLRRAPAAQRAAGRVQFGPSEPATRARRCAAEARYSALMDANDRALHEGRPAPAPQLAQAGADGSAAEAPPAAAPDDSWSAFEEDGHALGRRTQRAVHPTRSNVRRRAHRVQAAALRSLRRGGGRRERCVASGA